jgi:DNA-directed RNA polymerase beta subunit
MRALGIISDKSIIEICLLDLDKYSDMIDYFIPSIHDANTIFNQDLALEFISKFTKSQTISGIQNILMNYFLPHIGEDNYINKAYYVGFMVNKLLRVFSGKEAPTDRDNFKFKRIETSGSLIYDLFREYYLEQKQQIRLAIDKIWYFNYAKYKNNLPGLIIDNKDEFIFKERIIEKGFKKGFKGNWGSTEHTKRPGLVQDLNRLSWFTFISHLRKINLPLDPTAKIVGPHLLHNSQWGIIDPVDTPDGGNIGLHKHLAISSTITNSTTSFDIIKWLRYNLDMLLLTECTPNLISKYTKIFVNGNWIGVIQNPIQTVITLKLNRRNGIIPVYTSILFSYSSNIIYIYTDGGRLIRPIYYRNYEYDSVENKILYKNWSFDIINENIKKSLKNGDIKWSQIVSGLLPKLDNNFNIRNNILYFNRKQLYDDDDINLIDHACILDYMDVSEEENAMIATTPSDFDKNKYYTHCEIEPSLIFGVMGNSIIYPETNQFPRNCFSCGQSRQAVSLYHSNYQMRLDKMGVVLNYGQIPLIKSRYLDYINNEEQPYGVNAIVAIMCYTGYNVEDAILINEGSIKRGIFNTTYFTSYVAYEESSKVMGSSVESYFTNVDKKYGVKKLKDGYDYTRLDDNGLVKEGTIIDDKIILIGQVTSSSMDKSIVIDNSVTTKKGQLGIVDKSFLTEGEEGFRIAKIRIREERFPAIGDKMASRAGQKGTLGLIIPEQDMPFDENGVRPDLIINPHAIPSRMTIGQLVECLLGKLCSIKGAFGNCTAFSINGSNYDTYGSVLTEYGFHKSGNQVMYNGYTGEQIYSDIFIGPTYYMRLKHMVKDKINYRATGKRSALTRQTNQGRANDGGLRIGEMERDGIMAHGMASFLNESFMVRGDEYKMAICNKTGAIAIYNDEKNLFLSPFADGPLQYNITSKTSAVINSISKYGRSFSIVRIPYSLKLLIQELQVMNVQMRIITEDNIDQLLNLSYQSNNINKLLDITENLTGDEMSDMVKKYVNASLSKNTTEFYKSYADKNKKSSIKSVKELEVNELILLNKDDALKVFPEKSDVDYSKLYTTTIGKYSSSNNDGSIMLAEIIEQNTKPKEPNEVTITNGTSNIGSDTIKLALIFKNINAYEIDPINFEALKNNVETFKLNNVKLFNSNVVDNLDYNQDVIYIDAPWGGTDYKKSKIGTLNLYLSEVEISEFYMRYKDRASLFIFKVPTNYKFNNFSEKGIQFSVRDLIRGDRPIYTFIIIKGSKESNKQIGGGNGFSNPLFDEIYNLLSNEKQQLILKMEPDQQNNIMMKIYEKMQIQNGGQPISLAQKYFEPLPKQVQYEALSEAFNHMAKDFNNLANQMGGDNETIIQPEIPDDKIPTFLKPSLENNNLSDIKSSDNNNNNDSNSSSGGSKIISVKI